MVTTNNGAGLKSSQAMVGARIGMHRLGARERHELKRRLITLLGLTRSEFPSAIEVQDILGKIAAAIVLETAVPELARLLRDARQGKFDCVHVIGLPTDRRIAPLLSVMLGNALGSVFNYSSQNGGALVMKIVPEDGSRGNTNTTRAEFDWHSDDAWVPRNCRVSWISLFGVVNPKNTLTSYVPVGPILPTLSEATREWLTSETASVRAPLSFGLGDNVWSGPRAIITQPAKGPAEIAWPKYATRPVDPSDPVASDALEELAVAVERHSFSVAVDPGCFLAFNNLRGVHKRSPIGPGDRLVYRTYSTRSLEALREATGENGPIFDVTKTI
jgi:hypothetical protein